MQIRRLFGVLVLGGSALSGGLACGGGGGSDPAESEPDALGAGSVSEDPSDDGSSEAAETPSVETPSAASPCLCGQDPCCETGADGVSKPRAGMECCWGTSC